MALVVQSHRVRPPIPSGPAGALNRVSFRALGTLCEIQYATPDGNSVPTFEAAATGWVEAFEAKYSRFRPESLISKINLAAGKTWTEIDEATEQLFALCDTLHFLTQGILDPTLLPLMRLWDYKSEHPSMPSRADVDTARQLIGWKKVQRSPGRIFLPHPGMALDLGGFGKEYAVDVVAQIAVEHGIPDVLVDFGHDIRAMGRPPGRPAWHIGLENPQKPGESAGSVALTGNRGIASSGDYIRCVTFGARRYGHIIDPRTGWPVANGCVQATGIAGTCLHAGVLSTTAFVLGIPKGIEFMQSFPGAEGLIVTDNARAQTRGFFNHVVTN